jgi:hypothetical protein
MAHRCADDEDDTEDRKTEDACGVDNTPKVQAEDNSIAVGGINIRGGVLGNITIGHSYKVEQVSVVLTQITTFQKMSRNMPGRIEVKSHLRLPQIRFYGKFPSDNSGAVNLHTIREHCDNL